MEDLIKTVSEKAGIGADQARTAVNTVMEYIKNKVPGVGDKIKELIAGGGEGGGNLVDSLRKKVGI